MKRQLRFAGSFFFYFQELTRISYGKKEKKGIFLLRIVDTKPSKWMGQCPGCREWNTFVEEPAASCGKSVSGGVSAGAMGETEVSLCSFRIFRYRKMTV